MDSDETASGPGPDNGDGDDCGQGPAESGFEQGELVPRPEAVARKARSRTAPVRPVQPSLELDPPPVRVRRKPLGPKWEPFVLLPNDPDH